MEDLRSPTEVRGAMRQVFGAAAGIHPDTITSEALLRQPPPPADNLDRPDEEIPTLIEAVARRVLGGKMAALFGTDLILPEALARQRFGSLADFLHLHFNSLALSGAFIVVCDALLRDPHEVSTDTPIVHVGEPGARTFLMRVRDAIRARLCDTGEFEFTHARAAAVMNAKKVGTAMDAVIGGLKDAIENGGCI